MRISITTLSLALLLGIVTADIAAAGRRSRREERQAPQAEQAKAQAEAAEASAEMLRLNGCSTAAFGKYHETALWEVSVSGPLDGGWDEYREETLARQIELGVGGTGTIYLNGQQVAEDYAERHNEFTGSIEKVTVELR